MYEKAHEKSHDVKEEAHAGACTRPNVQACLCTHLSIICLPMRCTGAHHLHEKAHEGVCTCLRIFLYNACAHVLIAFPYSCPRTGAHYLHEKAHEAKEHAYLEIPQGQHLGSSADKWV